MSGCVVVGTAARGAVTGTGGENCDPGPGAMVCAKASLSPDEPLVPAWEAGAGPALCVAIRAGGAATRGIPAGGVGDTTGPAGGDATAPDPGLFTDTGALRAAPGAAPGVPERRWPQCWQNEKPTGVPLPQAGQIALAAAAAGCGADETTGAGGATVAATPMSTAMVAALPSGAACDAATTGAGLGLASSEVPHILQKFIPGGLSVPHELQVVPAAAAGAGLGAAAGSRRWPQS
jgi:hypothetical protein